MVVTNVGKSGLTLMLFGSGIVPNFLAIGSGSGTALVTNTNLVAETRSVLFTTRDVTISQEVNYTFDLNSAQMSGTNLREFGIKTSGLANIVWNRESFNAVNFDGTNELQVNIIFNVF